MSSHADLHWFKSSYSGTQGDSCVEVADGSGAVHVRDSKTHDGPQLDFTPPAWSSFLALATTHADPAGR